MGYSPWGHKESDTAEHSHTHTHTHTHMSLEGEPELYSKAALLFLDCSSSVSPPFPTWQLFEPVLLELREGHADRLKAITHNQEMVEGKDTERLLCPGALQGPAPFHWPLHLSGNGSSLRLEHPNSAYHPGSAPENITVLNP